MLRRLRRLFQSPRNARHRTDDPRGGVQTDEYRHATPVDVVEEAGVAMGGPGGAVPEELTPDERRERDRADGGS
jgi:hypothetical protein